MLAALDGRSSKMRNLAHKIKFTLLLIFFGVAFAWIIGSSPVISAQSDLAITKPTSPFSPSNAQTLDGNYIPVEQFFSATRCIGCHSDTHTAWSQSLHRNAAREPFYRESADILLKTRGIEFTRHCESCHTPIALFSGALNASAKQQQAPFTTLDNEGVTCTVCHAITEARLDGTGSYTIRSPALLANSDGAPVYGDFTDEQILADIPGHKRAVMRPLLRQPEFCATCHKVDAPPTLNNYKHIRGFTAYDEWQQSGASHESVLPFYYREQRTDCRACHMPKVESTNDKAGKRLQVSGVGSQVDRDLSHLFPDTRFIASHRWLGANTAVPQFYGQAEQVEKTTAFLQKEVLAIDIFALRREATGELIVPLDGNEATFSPGEEVTAEVVIANRNAAHSFPPEVRDLYEAWVEFEALDATGKQIFRSGYIKADGMLDESAHIYKQIILDEQGRTITRHQIWTTNLKAYDNAIPAGRSDVVRYRFRLPEATSSQFAVKPVRSNTANFTLRAKVNYRRFNQEYSEFILKRQNRQMTVPIVVMAEAKEVVGNKSSQFGVKTVRSNNREPSTANFSRRWNDYGIALLEQTQFGAAFSAFCRAGELNPDDPDLLTNAAIAAMRTERFGPEREQLHRAAELLERVLSKPQFATQNPRSTLRARYYRALVWRAEGKLSEAAAELVNISQAYPRDREVLCQLAQTNYSLGQLANSRTNFEALLGIDPTDAGAWQFLSPLYLSLGRNEDAQKARQKYLLWRDDPRADAIAARFLPRILKWADERIGAHTHGVNAAARQILTGNAAVPDK